MEASLFALGKRVPPEIKESKEKLQVTLKKPKRKVQTRPPLKSWRIIPNRCSPEGISFTIDTLLGNTYLEKKRSLQRRIDTLQKKNDFLFNAEKIEQQNREFLAYYARVAEVLEMNQKMRWIFKRLYNYYHVSHLRKVNITDPITLLPFRYPIVLNNFKTKTQYTFEAESFARHAHKSLLHHDGQIPCSKLPKNPYTNEELSFIQLLSLLTQSRKYGFTFWTIEAFVDHRYSMVKFQKTHQKPLRLYAIQDTLKSLSDLEAFDIVYDFIRSHHRDHKKQFPKNIYEWALEEASDDDVILRWKKYCLEWYEIDILEDDEFTKNRKFDRILSSTEKLCEFPLHLFERKKRKIEGNR